MVVQLIGRQRSLHYTHQGWQKMVYLALRYGWKPLGTKLQNGGKAETQDSDSSSDAPGNRKQDQRDQAQGMTGFDESTWSFSLDSSNGIPPNHPLAYCSDVLFYCEDPVVQSYFDNSQVGKADAGSFAAALEKALAHMPEGPEGFQDHKPGALFNPMEWFDPNNRDDLSKLIAFCKRGGFKLVP